MPIRAHAEEDSSELSENIKKNEFCLKIIFFLITYVLYISLFGIIKWFLHKRKFSWLSFFPWDKSYFLHIKTYLYTYICFACIINFFWESCFSRNYYYKCTRMYVYAQKLVFIIIFDIWRVEIYLNLLLQLLAFQYFFSDMSDSRGWNIKY